MSVKVTFNLADVLQGVVKSPPPQAKKIHKTLDDLNIENEENMVRLRKHLGYFMAGTMAVWLLLVIFVVFLQGIKILYLDSNVLITLLTTTTANVIFMSRIIVKSLYPEKSNNKETS